MNWNIYNNLSETKNKAQVQPGYVARFDPEKFLPEDIKESLKEYEKINNIIYTNHAMERINQRGVVTFRSIDINDMNVRDIDKKTSMHDAQKGKLNDSFLAHIQKVEATYNPKTGGNEILRVSYRIQNVLERSSSSKKIDGTTKEEKSPLDMVLVVSGSKMNNPNKKTGIVVTAWTCSSDDYEYEFSTNFCDQKRYNMIKDRINKDYRFSLSENTLNENYTPKKEKNNSFAHEEKTNHKSSGVPKPKVKKNRSPAFREKPARKSKYKNDYTCSGSDFDM